MRASLEPALIELCSTETRPSVNHAYVDHQADLYSSPLPALIPHPSIQVLAHMPLIYCYCSWTNHLLFQFIPGTNYSLQKHRVTQHGNGPAQLVSTDQGELCLARILKAILLSMFLSKYLLNIVIVPAATTSSGRSRHKSDSTSQAAAVENMDR